jgi:hypothetical protein
VLADTEFDSLQREKACQDFGYELFTLFAQYRRLQVGRSVLLPPCPSALLLPTLNNLT